jgi:hypothetical protein
MIFSLQCVQAVRLEDWSSYSAESREEMAPLSVPTVTVFSGYPGNRKRAPDGSSLYSYLLFLSIFFIRKGKYITVQYSTCIFELCHLSSKAVAAQ